MRVLITGANGFVGAALVRGLSDCGLDVVAASRSFFEVISKNVRQVTVGDIDGGTDWSAALVGCDAVVHAAARVHVLCEVASEPGKEYRKVNVDGTIRLARQAVKAGVRRFIFISSIKVNGESTKGSVPFTCDAIPQPSDPYAISKHDAERGLFSIAAETGLEVVVVRPPLVYGPGVKANFQLMMRLVSKGIPLPFGAAHNRRSFISLANLVDFVSCCLTHPAASGQIFLISDGDDLSTVDLVRKISDSFGIKPRLVSFPLWSLQALFYLLGRKDLEERLLGSLVLDVEKSRRLLGWSPVQTVEDGLSQAVQAFLCSESMQARR